MIIVGSIFIGLVAFYFFFVIFTDVNQFNNISKSLGSNQLVLIPLSIAAGVLIDALADIIVRNPIRTAIFQNSEAISSKLLTWLAVQRRMKVTLDGWSRSFQKLYADTDLNKIDDEMDGVAIAPQNLAAAFFHNKAPKEQFTWASSHYATYLLATNLLVLTFISLFCGFFSTISGWKNVAIFLVGHIIVAWLFFTIAFDRFVYTYVYTFRSACLIIIGDRTDETADLTPHS